MIGIKRLVKLELESTKAYKAFKNSGAEVGIEPTWGCPRGILRA